ncbi:MAG: tetratricopeptide repeat protein [Anaerolineales bacterium]|nr:tetratricopeptide repeat protein [Anaerolineales bacterium]
MTHARNRHAHYYLSLVQDAPDDIAYIQTFYPQLKNAWRTLTNPQLQLDYIWHSKHYQNQQGLWADYEAWLKEGIRLCAAGVVLLEDQWALHNNLGIVQFYQGRSPEALQQLQVALDIAYRTQSDEHIANTLSNMAGIHYANNQWSTALELCQQALPLVTDEDDRIALLNHLSGIYLDLDQSEQALEYAEAALEVVQASGDISGQRLVTLITLGRIHLYHDQPLLAIDYLQQANQEAIEAGDIVTQAACQLELGKVYEHLKDYTTAQKHLRAALVTQEQLNDLKNLSSTLLTLGQILHRLGQRENALAYFERALTISRQLDQPANIAAKLNEIGRIYTDLDQSEQALLVLQEALALNRQVQNDSGISTNLTNLATAYWQLGRKDLCFAHLEEALTNQKGQVTSGIFVTLHNLIMFAEADGNLDLARHYITTLLAIEEAPFYVDVEQYQSWQARLVDTA